MDGRNGAAKTLSAQKLIPVLIYVLLVIAAFAVFDLLLVRAANLHRAQTGTELFERGVASRRAGKPVEALEYLRAARNHSPRNAEYDLAFAQALRAVDRVREGRAAIEGLLARQPAHGAANAELARALADDGDWQRAAWYYHRALYGEWQGSTDLRGLRFELADLLAQHGAREQLLAEVLLLDADIANETEARHLARLRLAASEWEGAQTIYRTLLRSKPDDSELIAGLARAQFGMGRYVAAERTYRRALNTRSPDPAVERELRLTATINQMDPSLRRLTPEEKHRRAHDLTAMLLADLRSCSPANPALAAPERDLENHQRVRNPLVSAEADLDVFERLWTIRHEVCSSSRTIPEEMRLLAAQLVK